MIKIATLKGKSLLNWFFECGTTENVLTSVGVSHKTLVQLGALAALPKFPGSIPNIQLEAHNGSLTPVLGNPSPNVFRGY